MERTETDSPAIDSQDLRCTVVVVNFNGGELLLRSLAAVLESTLPVEVILIDNASSDGSAKQAKSRFPQITLLENEHNRGFAVAANQGLRSARARTLLLLNPDCILQSDTLEKMLEVLRCYREVGMAGCRILNPDGTEQRGCRRNLPTLGSGLRKAAGRQKSRKAVDLHLQPLPDQPQFVEAISGAFMLVTRQALHDVGFLDEDYFMHCEDLDWCRRFLDAGLKILFVPHVEVVHYRGTCSKATPVRVSWYLHRGMVRYYRKYLARENGLVITLLVIPAIYGRFLWLTLRRQLGRISGRA
ncbi:glycosyltransferase family 2 protein [Thiolapillus sp.]|uniref:glycosyltransferase family 2 protein n=2 Tax=Thiolapillus sp. TaxID=2017437 RepID=UPI003AF7FD97